MVYTIHHFARIAGSFLLAAAVLIAPWLFRSSIPNAEITVRALVTGATFAALTALLVAPTRVRRNRSFARLVPTALILLAGIAIGIFQIIPHPGGIGKLSPGVDRYASQLLPEEGSQEAAFETELMLDEEVRSFPESGFWPNAMSVCTQVTKDQVSELIYVFAAFVSAGILFQTKRQRLFLWRAIAVNGVLLALLVMGSKLFGDRLPGYRSFWPEAVCGPFINRNNMAGYLAICLAPTVALVLLEILDGIRRRDDEDLYYEGMRVESRSAIQRFFNGISDFFSIFSGRMIPWLLAAALMMVAAAMTLSRGGTLAVLFTFVTAAVLFSLRRRAGLYLVPVWGGLFIAFCLLFWLGVNEPIQQRMGTLFETEQSESVLKTNPRLDNWKSALETAKTYDMRGSGLGTYPLANRSRDKALRIDRYFFFAENIAIEIFVTAGLVGLFLLLCGYLFFWYYVVLALRMGKEVEKLEETEDNNLVYAIKCENADLTYIFGIGIAALLVGLTVSGSFDFGLFLYPNALAAALLLGSFAGGRLDDSDDSAGDFSPWDAEEPLQRRIPPFVGTLVLSLIASVLVFKAFFYMVDRIETARVVELYLAPVQPNERDMAYFNKAEADLRWAIGKRPEDPVFHYQLSQVYQAKFRHLFWDQLQKEYPDTEKDELWNRTTPESIYASMYPLLRGKMKVVPRQFRSDPIVSENLRPALRELWKVRRLCPFYPEPYIESAVIAPLLFEMDDYDAFTRTSLDRLAKVSPNEPSAFFAAGLIEFLSGNRDAAAAKWKETAALSDDRLADITLILASDRLRADFRRHLGEVIGGDWNKALLGTTLFPKKESPLIFAVYLELMGQILAAADDKTTPQWYHDSAVYAALSDKPAEAFDLYKKATEADPFNAAWHYEFGEFLTGAKRDAEAADEYSRASDLDPKNRKYRKAAGK